MASTAYGNLPYPDGLGNFNNPPADIKALAEALAARLPRTGSITKTPPATAQTGYAVTFDPPFPTGVQPGIGLSLEGNIDWIYAGIAVGSVTNTGFTIVLRNAYTSTSIGAATVRYVAFHP